MSKSIHPPLDHQNVSLPPPPPPPAWRHWLLPIGILVALILWIFLPANQSPTPINLGYSQFLSLADNHQIKSVSFGSSAGRSTTAATGELENGKSYTAVIPGQPTPELNRKLTIDGVSIRVGTWILGAVLLSLGVFLIPLFFMFLLLRSSQSKIHDFEQSQVLYLSQILGRLDPLI